MTKTNVKYPEISVKLTGENGNAFLILGKVLRALDKGGVPKEIRNEFEKEATAGDYDHLLQTVMQWVDVT